MEASESIRRENAEAKGDADGTGSYINGGPWSREWEAAEPPRYERKPTRRSEYRCRSADGLMIQSMRGLEARIAAVGSAYHSRSNKMRLCLPGPHSICDSFLQRHRTDCASRWVSGCCLHVAEHLSWEENFQIRSREVGDTGEDRKSQRT